MSGNKAEIASFTPASLVQDCWNDPQVVEEWHTRPMKEEIIDSIKSVISLEAKGLSENAQILDLACGANPFPYSPSDRQNIFMLDISPGMLKLNRSPIKVIADARRLLPFSNNTFEMVTCIFGMKYFENQEEVAADMLRILKPSGKAILIDVTRKKYKNGSLRLFMNRKLIERFIGENKNISVKSRILIRPFFGYPRLDLITITKTGSNVIH